MVKTPTWSAGSNLERRYTAMGSVRSGGFTLLELLVVIGVMAITLAVVAANYAGLDKGAGLKKFARETVALLRHSRSEAMVSGRPVWLKVTQGGRQLTLYPAEKIILVPDSLDIDYGGARVPSASHTQDVYFYPDGTSNGGRLSISAAEGRLYIDINWLTGEVQLAH